MARKNIFEILANNQNIGSDAERINRLFFNEDMLILGSSSYKMKNYIQYYCFDDWENKDHCIDLDDFLDTIEYENILFFAKRGDVDSFLTLIEMIFNFWKLVEIKINAENSNLNYYTDFYHLYDIMTDCLSKLNHKAVYKAEEEKVLVIEDKPEVTVAAEIVEDETIAFELLEYNHHSLKGDLSKKRKILASIGSYVEPILKDNILSKSGYKDLESNVGFLLNKFHIRHNNKEGKTAQDYIMTISDEDLEMWYDRTYDVLIQAILTKENIAVEKDIEQLKKEYKWR